MFHTAPAPRNEKTPVVAPAQMSAKKNTVASRATPDRSRSRVWEDILYLNAGQLGARPYGIGRCKGRVRRGNSR